MITLKICFHLLDIIIKFARDLQEFQEINSLLFSFFHRKRVSFHTMEKIQLILLKFPVTLRDSCINNWAIGIQELHQY